MAFHTGCQIIPFEKFGPDGEYYMYIPQTKTARQGRGSYFFSIVIPLEIRIAGGLIVWIPGLLVVSLGT